MRIGVPREIKVHEYRVGLVPAGVRELVAAGHEVLIESGAGAGIGVDDAQFRAAGAAIAARAAEVFERADLVVKVKEPQPAECEMLRRGQVLFTYLHLAADRAAGRGPDEVRRHRHRLRDGDRAERLAAAADADERGRRAACPSRWARPACRKPTAASACCSGGVPGVPPAKVVILGGGVSGTHAAEMAVGLRADVTVVDRSVERLRELSSIFGPALRTAYSTTETIEELVRDADLVIGAVLVVGRRGAEARHARHGQDHEARRGAGGHRHRPGRLLRDQPAHHARRARPSSSTGSFTTAWPTCRARCRAPRRSR